MKPSGIPLGNSAPSVGHPVSDSGHPSWRRISIDSSPPTTAMNMAVMMYWMPMIL